MVRPLQFDRREEIIAAVANGMMLPTTAEELARNEGWEPFERQPDPLDFDPLKEPDWTLPMAILWIACRTSEAVRDAWNDYREECWFWRIRRPQPQTAATIYAASDLQRRGRFKLVGLAVAAGVSEQEKLIPGYSMPVAEAKTALWSALRNAALDATGIDVRTGRRMRLGALDWRDLDFDEQAEGETLLLTSGPDTGTLAYSDVRVPSGGVVGIWGMPKADSLPLLPPLMRPDGPGFMAFFCAAQWIATKRRRDCVRSS